MFTFNSILIQTGFLAGFLSFVLFLFIKNKSDKQKLHNYQAIYNSIWDAILIVDTDRKVLDCNMAFEKLFEYPLSELKSRLTDFLYEDSSGFQKMGGILFHQSHRQKERASIPYKTKSGQIIICEVGAFPINDNKTGKLLGYIGVFRDVTEKKLAEIELKTLHKGIERSPAAVMITDHQGNIEYVNPQFLKTTGYSAKEVVGKNPRILQSGQTSPDVYKSLWKALKKGKSWDGEFINKKKTGEIFLFSESISPIIGEDGSITHFIGVGQDITKRHANEIKIQEALKEKTVLLAEVHHRVKNNLAIISGLLDLQSIRTPEVKDILKLSQNRIHSIAQVHELMYQSNNFAQVDLNEYINKMSAIIEASFNSENFTVKVNVDVVRAALNVNQAVPLGMMINELITNSFTHAFEGYKEGSISIQLEQLNDIISIKYSDNGKGIQNLKTFSDFNGNHSLGVELIEILSTQLGAFDQFLSGTEGFCYSFKFKIAHDAKGSSAHHHVI